MVDLDFIDVARWIAEPIEDTIAFENWIGNRLYGIETNEGLACLPAGREKALEIAKLRKVGEVREVRDFWVYINGMEPKGVVKIGDFGTVVALDGKPEKIEVNKMKIPADEIFIIKVPKGEKIKLEIKHKFKTEVEGGEVGIIIDTRGRPLALPTADSCGRERLKKWQKTWQSS